MRASWILYSAVLLFACTVPAHGLFNGGSLQDYIDSFIDATKFKLDGIVSLNDSSIVRMWSFFKSKYGRTYSSIEEEKQRLRVFRDHLKFVLESNLKKLQTFQLELNEFADWTIEEFNSLKKGLVLSSELRRQLNEDYDSDEDSVRRSLHKLYQRHHQSRRLKRSSIYKRHHHRHSDRRGFTDWLWNLITSGSGGQRNNTDNSGGQSSNSFDWRTRNVVGSIKDQMNCGCCYAFATAAVLETLYAIKTKSNNVIDLSAQQIADCSGNGNNGCSGGNFPPSVRYILSQGGKLATAESYPYVGRRQQCRTSGFNQINFGNIQVGAVPEGDEKAMAALLVSHGPIFIGLDADSKLFMFYKSGILNINNCPTRRQDMDHAMVVVGYGYDSALRTPYWIIKNSWAQRWGENGYLRLAKDSGNMCGVASLAYYAKLA